MVVEMVCFFRFVCSSVVGVFVMSVFWCMIIV